MLSPEEATRFRLTVRLCHSVDRKLLAELRMERMVSLSTVLFLIREQVRSCITV